VLRHSFYERWVHGELAPRELAFYAGQYRHAVVALADAAPHAGDERHAEEERSHAPAPVAPRPTSSVTFYRRGGARYGGHRRAQTDPENDGGLRRSAQRLQEIDLGPNPRGVAPTR
jgi:hypothetical protein